MDYELAKKLKDAGFPHKWAKDFDIALDHAHPEDCKCLPTLSELIKVCGNRFRELICWNPGGFEARDILGRDTYESHSGFGKTPEEAVANLWLELNKNKNGKE